jgi:hypothetical protein
MSHSTISQVGDNIYVNVTFGTDPTMPAQLETAAEYRVVKTIPILKKCSDYYCSVIRFTIPLNDTPLFIMPISPGLLNANFTPFFIGITTGGINFPQRVIYTPETGGTGPLQNQSTQVITPYYFVYSYQNLINSINNALGLSFVASGLVGNAPYFYLNTGTKELNLVVDISNFAPTWIAGSIQPVPLATIFINTSLQQYLSAFDFIYDPIMLHYTFNLIRYGLDDTIPPFSTSATQKQFSQEYSTLNLWTSLRKILITTNSIPIISEYTPSNNSGISSTLPIITDFVPQIETPGQNRSIAYYVPTSQYRLADMTSSEQLNTIDLKIYWQDTQGNIYPLIISKYQQASVKLGFFKKSLYNSTGLLLKK